jgi:hypothetical protein
VLVVENGENRNLAGRAQSEGVTLVPSREVNVITCWATTACCFPKRRRPKFSEALAK